jgi:EmrB/QacA subfamily drug resistance transporter
MTAKNQAIPAGSAPKAEKNDSRRWFALPVLLTGAFLPILDFNVVNLALPEIRKSLGATASDVQFVISAYAATYAVFLITGGRLGDWLGRKRMFIFGIAGFTLVSTLCGIAWSADILITGRILQGLTAAVMAPQVLASIRTVFSPAEQSKALGLYGATFGLANIVGQIMGGVLVTFHPFGLAWQAIFLINVPIGLLAIIGSVLFLENSYAEHAQKIDLGGVILLSATLCLLVYPLIEGRALAWPLWIIIMLAASPVALLVFIRFEQRVLRRASFPLLDLSLFRQRGFAIGIAMALLYYMLSSFYLTFSVYLQGGLHLTALDAGLRTLPFGLGYFIASFASAGIMLRLGPRALTLGFAVQVLGFGLVIFAIAGELPQYTEIGLATAGLGYGIVMPLVIKAIIGGIDRRHAGLASGIAISTFQIGAALGVAVLGGVFYNVLGAGDNIAIYAHAFAITLSCNVVLLIAGGVLSLGLPHEF